MSFQFRSQFPLHPIPLQCWFYNLVESNSEQVIGGYPNDIILFRGCGTSMSAMRSLKTVQVVE